MMNKSIIIPTLQLTFNLLIYPRQIRNWRGAFIEMAGFRDDLFHNHQGEKGYHYRYPLIQYRVKNRSASVFAIGDGVSAVQKVLSENEWLIRWNNQPRTFQVQNISMNQCALQMSNRPIHYRLFKYIPFNQDNYQIWRQSDHYIQRIELIQKMLTGHILGFAEAMNYQVPSRIQIDIQSIQRLQKVRMHGAEVLAFDLAYTCNMILPDGIGLGRSSSHGFGWQKSIRRPKKWSHYPNEASLNTQKV